MSGTGLRENQRRGLVWLLVGMTLLLVVAANGHLVYVAVTSEPGCVEHRRPGETAGTRGFSAARSACVSPATSYAVAREGGKR